MISTSLENIAKHLAARVITRTPLDLHELNQLEAKLADLAAQARHIEDTPFLLADMLDANGEAKVCVLNPRAKVVSMAAYRRQASTPAKEAPHV